MSIWIDAFLLALIAGQFTLIWALVRRNHVLDARARDRDDRMIREMHGALLRVKSRPQGAIPLEAGVQRELPGRPMPIPAGLARDFGVPHIPKNGSG